MASIGFPGSIPNSLPRLSSRAAASPAAGRWVAPIAAAVARRPTREQGTALEMLGHAVEYLVDSYVMNGDRDQPMRLRGPELDAVQLLMRANREVFAACAEVVPVGRRLRQWAFGRLRAA